MYSVNLDHVITILTCKYFSKQGKQVENRENRGKFFVTMKILYIDKLRNLCYIRIKETYNVDMVVTLLLVNVFAY